MRAEHSALVDHPWSEHTVTSYDGTVVAWIEYGRGFPIVVSSPIGIPISFWLPLFSRLATQYRFVFIKRRGLYGAAVPADLEQLGVEAHARDIAAVVEALDTTNFSALGFCSGVAPLVSSLLQTSLRPRRVALFSGRFCPGKAVAGRHWMKQVRVQPDVHMRVLDVFLRFAPLSVRDELKSQLLEMDRLEAHIVAIELSRSYVFDVLVPSDVPVSFFYGEHDYEEIISSTHEYAERLVHGAKTTRRIAGVQHFYLLDHVEHSVRLVLEFCQGLS